VEIRSRDLDPKNVPPLKTLLSSCLGLVTVEVSSSTIRLVHFTLQEHLLRDPTLFHSPHSAIAEVCLTYLNFGYIRDLSPDDNRAPEIHPLLDYASCYWGEHARKGMTEDVKVLVLSLLDTFDEHISAILLIWGHDGFERWRRELYEAEGRKKCTGLHGAAFLGIVEIFAAVLELKKWEVNKEDCFGRTALTWAAEKGHVAVVKMLLQQEDINPDQADTYSAMTPLMWAADSGHDGVVNALLEREDVNPDAARRGFGSTALAWAADSGHAGVVEILLGRVDVSPNQQLPGSEKTLLFWAVEKGHQGVVKLLLEREDLDPNTVDMEYGDTLLLWAVCENHEGILRLLLERRDVDPNDVDIPGGRGPLSRAASVPNRPVRPTLGTAGLTQAFSETAGPDCGKPAFQKKAGPGLGDLQASGF